MLGFEKNIDEYTFLRGGGGYKKSVFCTQAKMLTFLDST